MRSAWFGTAALLSLLVSAAHGATVSGTVRGPDGAAFRGAFVQAQHAGTKITTSVLSDRQGGYRFENLPPGTYQLRVRALGYDAAPLVRRDPLLRARRDERPFVSPAWRRCLFTVRAAISSARGSPFASSDALMCSYCRSRLLLTPRIGMIDLLM